MILVDSSVLIDYLKGKKSDSVQKLELVLNERIVYGITYDIYTELLQGTSSKKDFRKLKEYLDTFTFYTVLYGRESYANAAHLYSRCRKKGITIRSTVDCLIVQTVLENDLRLLHNDRDFEFIKKVENRLIFF